MDSITQALLGASVAAAVAGRSAGRRAAAWGAVLGTLPDLDALIPLSGPVADFTYHRGYSHSLVILSLAAPVLWWIISRLDQCARASPRRWLLLVWLTLITHPLLDAFTVYGTQLFLPFSDYPVSGSSVFIIDPAVTVPLALGLVIAVLGRRRGRARYSVHAGLGVAVMYLGASVVVKLHVENVAREALRAQLPGYDAMLTTPAPFNIVLWRIVVMEQSAYREAFYSLLDPPGALSFQRYESHPELLEGIAESWPVRRLRWFTHGFYAVGQSGDRVVMTDLRMGVEPVYAFSFAVGRRAGDETFAIDPIRLEPARPAVGQLAGLLRRVAGPMPASVDARSGLE